MELRVLGAPGLYVQAMEVLLEAAHHVPTISYTTHDSSLICSFEHSELPHEQLLSLVSKVNHLVKVTGAGANLDDADVVQLSIPMAETITSGGGTLRECPSLGKRSHALVVFRRSGDWSTY